MRRMGLSWERGRWVWTRKLGCGAGCGFGSGWFVGLLLLDPVRNKWVFTFGLIGCAGAVALIAGAVRAIPI